MVMLRADSAARPGLREVLTDRGTRRWGLGAIVALGWLVTIGVELYSIYPGVAERVIGTALIALFGLCFLLTPPITYLLPAGLRLLGPLGLFALSFTLFPLLGFGVCSVWTYVGVAAAMTLVRMKWVVLFVIVLAGLSVLFEFLDGARGVGVYALPLVVASISLMMAAFARQILAVAQLRATQHELATLAVAEERSRVARDLHDILGHSLTVVTVKAELAARLIDTDPAAAKREIEDVEDLARGALADVRSTVAGFRGVSVAAELANARSALAAAGIRASLPGAVDQVPASSRELFGWVVREGVTNVVRHSGATQASVALAPDSVEVTDDGSGPSKTASDGNGLAGLRERVEAAGGRMTIGRSQSGGFRLAVSLSAPVPA
ncbi:MAG: histidine kinase [Microbacteriaceae bacterium]|nr:histidine kinase [Microbacteriaceae bacterium]